MRVVGLCCNFRLLPTREAGVMSICVTTIAGRSVNRRGSLAREQLFCVCIGWPANFAFWDQIFIQSASGSEFQRLLGRWSRIAGQCLVSATGVVWVNEWALVWTIFSWRRRGWWESVKWTWTYGKAKSVRSKLRVFFCNKFEFWATWVSYIKNKFKKWI